MFCSCQYAGRIKTSGAESAAARECPSRGLVVEGLVAPPSCSLRAAVSLLPRLHQTHLACLSCSRCSACFFRCSSFRVQLRRKALPSRRSSVRAFTSSFAADAPSGVPVLATSLLPEVCASSDKRDTSPASLLVSRP